MDTTVEREFLEYSTKKMRQFLSRIQDCTGKLSFEQVWLRGSENENAVGNLLLHLNGNVRQWIISGVGGKPDVRARDREFSARGGTEPADLLQRLQDTVEEALGILQQLGPGRLVDRVTIQKYNISVLEAIYHVVEHFAQHTGQIIFVTKMLTGQDLGYYAHLKEPKAQSQTP